MSKNLLFSILFFALNLTCVLAQDFSQIGKAKLFSYSGGVSANSVYYDGSAIRDPFTYVLNGNINFNFSGLYNVPLSFTYSNQEFEYSRPFKFNRLSINPSYKWISAHIGDVSMTFSPYTLSGHQFTGLGLDLTPKGKFKISAMYGRLIRPIEFNIDDPQSTPAYKRIGYGIKTSYDFEKINLGLTIFSAKDEINSLDTAIPLEVGIAPKENLVVSIQSSFKLLDDIQFDVEYATSAVTENLDSDDFDGSLGPLSFIFNEKLTTSYYDALNLNLNYAVGNGSVGAGYERIDPGYKTLGAYFFSNDLENITVNAAQTIFNGKLGINVNAGLQRDNLDDTKKSELKKIVTAINLNYTASEKTTISASYSNFQSFTNIRSQFDYINEITQFDNIDTLNFKQLSRNANANIGYILSKSKEKQQNLNLNVSLQDVRDLQEQSFTGVENTINTTQLLNSALGYTIAFPERSLNFSAVANVTFNETKTANTAAYGPTLVVGKQFFDKQLRTTFSSSYNASSTDGVKQTDILNFRFNAGYQLKKVHSFNLSLLSLFRKSIASQNSNDFTATLAYSYSFSSGDWKLKFGKGDKRQKNQKTGLPIVNLRYRETIYKGNALEILSQIEVLRSKDMPVFKQNALNNIKDDIILLKAEEPKVIKDRIIDYLDAIYHYIDFKEAYDDIIFNSILLLKKEAARIDGEVEGKFVELRYKIESHKFKGQDPQDIKGAEAKELEDYKIMYDKYIDQRQKFVGHRWMQDQINDIENYKDYNKKKELNKFKPQYLNDAYKVFSDENSNIEKVELFLLIKLIEYYQELAKGKVDPNNYKLKYTGKSN